MLSDSFIDQPIIILSLGRSGSTYVQRLMNCIDNFYIFGEHSGLLWNASEMFQILETDSTPSLMGNLVLDKRGYQDQFIAWAAPFRLEEFLRAFREFLLKLYISALPKNARWGFKEIRYTQLKDIKFIFALFPNAKIIIISREYESWITSIKKSFYSSKEFEQDDLKHWMEKRNEFEENILNNFNLNDKNIIRVEYEKIIENPFLFMQKVCDFLDVDVENINMNDFNIAASIKIG